MPTWVGIGGPRKETSDRVKRLQNPEDVSLTKKPRVQCVALEKWEDGSGVCQLHLHPMLSSVGKLGKLGKLGQRSWLPKGVVHENAEFGSMFQTGLGLSTRNNRMCRWPHPRSSPLPRASHIQCWSIWRYKDPAISLLLRTIWMGHTSCRWEHIGSWGFRWDYFTV